MAMAALGPTKPAAGVIVARPEMAPEAAPSVVGFPSFNHSIKVHVAIPAIPAR